MSLSLPALESSCPGCLLAVLQQKSYFQCEFQYDLPFNILVIGENSSFRTGNVQVDARNVWIDIWIEKFWYERAGGSCRIPRSSQHPIPVLIPNIGVAIPGKHGDHQLFFVLRKAIMIKHIVKLGKFCQQRGEGGGSLKFKKEIFERGARKNHTGVWELWNICKISPCD